jgi:hypothetical protein
MTSAVPKKGTISEKLQANNIAELIQCASPVPKTSFWSQSYVPHQDVTTSTVSEFRTFWLAKNNPEELWHVAH